MDLEQIKLDKMKRASWAIFFVAMFLTCNLPLSFAEDTSYQDTTPSSESIEMIAERMSFLSSSLAHLPRPPKMDETIQLPLSNQPIADSTDLTQTNDGG